MRDRWLRVSAVISGRLADFEPQELTLRLMDQIQPQDRIQSFRANSIGIEVLWLHILKSNFAPNLFNGPAVDIAYAATRK